jgi:hypothetical protein
MGRSPLSEYLRSPDPPHDTRNAIPLWRSIMSGITSVKDRSFQKRLYS